MANTTSVSVNELKINVLTDAQYKAALANNQISETELYMIKDPEGFSSSYYGTCSTAAATVDKVVDCEGFILKKGATIKVKFTNSNTAENPTLNVNGTGAVDIYYRGAAVDKDDLVADQVYDIIYNGAQYEVISGIVIDERVTSVENHYVPTTENNTTKSASGATAAATGDTLQVVTGITIDAAGHVTGVVSGAVQDRDTTYNPAGAELGLVKNGGNVTVSEGIITVNDNGHKHTIANVDGLQAAIDAAKQSGDNAQAAVDALSDKVGTVPENKTIVSMISEAQTAATYDDTAVRGLISDNAEAIATEKARMDAFLALDDGETLDAALDSLKELQDYITSEAAEADAIVGRVAAIEGILDGIGGEGESATVVAYVAAAIEAIKIGDYAKAAELADLAERVAAMEAKVTDWDDAVAKEHEHTNKTLLDTYTQTEEDLADAVAKKHEHANATELARFVEGDKAKLDEAYDKAHEHKNKDVIDGITAAKVAAWDAAESNAKSYADSLASNYDASGAADTALASAKTYADQSEADAISAAKTYTDTLFTWSSF